MPELVAAQQAIENTSPEETLAEHEAVWRLERLVNDHAHIAIVFAAMAVEGFIFYYAVETGKLTESWVSNYIDKIDLKAKWVVIPRLITGQELQAGGHGLNLLGDLIRARNALVHYKSRDIGAFYNQAMQEAGPDDRMYLSDWSEAEGVAWQDGAQWFTMGPRASKIFWTKWQKLLVNYAEQARKAVQTLDVLAKELHAIDPKSFVHQAFVCPPPK